MSIETELQQALDTIDSMEQHTAAAYAALQQNGATLPEVCGDGGGDSDSRSEPND